MSTSSALTDSERSAAATLITAAFEEDLRDGAHMLELLHSGRYYAGQGLPEGKLRAYELEEEVSTTG